MKTKEKFLISGVKVCKFLVFSLIFVIMLFFSFACSSSSGESGAAYLTAAEMCHTEEKSNPKKDVKSFKINNVYYYVFDLGIIRSVPLQEGVCVERKLKSQKSIVFSAEKASTETISTFVSKTVETYTEWTDSGLKVGGEIALNDRIKFNFEKALEKTEVTGERTTAYESYETASNTYQATSIQTELQFEKDDPFGYYRCVLTGDVKLYGVVMVDNENGEYYADNYSLVENPRYNIEFSEKSSFGEYEVKKITFDISLNEVKNLPVPENELIEEQGVWNDKDYLGGYGTSVSPYLIATATHLQNIRKNPEAHFRLLNDIDFSWKEWQPVGSFSGVFDGNEFTLSHLKIVSHPNGLNKYAGLFAVNTIGSVVKNLRISESSIVLNEWQATLEAGFISGCNEYGVIENCRVEDCIINVSVSAQEEKYRGREFYCNAGGITGVARHAKINQCCIDKIDLYSYSWVKYNQLKAMARAGGVAGYAADSTIENCFITHSKKIKAVSETKWGELVNQAKSATAYAGGICGQNLVENGKAIIKYCIVYDNAEVVSSAKTRDGLCETAQHGYFFGATHSTQPYALICFDPKRIVNNYPSGNNSRYLNENEKTKIVFEEITYTNLIKNISDFKDQICWLNDNGNVVLSFTRKMISKN